MRNHPCNRRSFDLHSAFRAELLTAEASNTATVINPRFSVFHADGFRGADIPTLLAANADGFLNPRARCDAFLSKAAEQKTAPAFQEILKLKAAPLANRFKITAHELTPGADNLRNLGETVQQASGMRRAKRWNSGRIQANHFCAKQIDLMRILAGNHKAEWFRRTSSRAVPFHSNNSVNKMQMRLPILVKIHNHICKIIRV